MLHYPGFSFFSSNISRFFLGNVSSPRDAFPKAFGSLLLLRCQDKCHLLFNISHDFKSHYQLVNINYTFVFLYFNVELTGFLFFGLFVGFFFFFSHCLRMNTAFMLEMHPSFAFHNPAI